MARREVIEVTCDRCGRVETQSLNEGAKKDDKGPELTVVFQGETHSYEDLCRRCRSAVTGYVEKIAKTDAASAKEENVTPIDPGANRPQRSGGLLGGGLLGGK